MYWLKSNILQELHSCGWNYGVVSLICVRLRSCVDHDCFAYCLQNDCEHHCLFVCLLLMMLLLVASLVLLIRWKCPVSVEALHFLIRHRKWLLHCPFMCSMSSFGNLLVALQSVVSCYYRYWRNDCNFINCNCFHRKGINCYFAVGEVCLTVSRFHWLIFVLLTNFCKLLRDYQFSP